MQDYTQNTQNQEKPLIFWLGMLAVLFAAVIGIFALMELAIPMEDGRGSGSWNAVYSKDGAPTPYSVRTVGEKEREERDISRWLTASGDYIAQDLGGDSRDAAFWLYRQDSDEYVLYLPEQDRAVAPVDITANEEKDEDGSTRLVIRIRTDEEAEEVVPREQLLSFRTTTAKWNGIRLTIILDGREQQVRVMTSREGELFTAEESYIGRN